MEDIERGTLKRLFELKVPSRERYWFVCPKETAETSKVLAFKKWVLEELKSR